VVLADANITLKPEQWARAREIYSVFLNSPTEEQSRLFAELCNEDPQLESCIRGLLKAHNQGSSFLNEPAWNVLDAFSSIPVPADLEEGTILSGRFKVGRRLNQGGMGAVYEAWDAELQESVALKVIRPEIASQPLVIERFKQEVRQARRIAHPNVCRVYELYCHERGPDDKVWFLAMELIEGKTLLETVRESGPLPRKRALPIIAQMISGLAAAHELGIVHRDFKTSNVMLESAPGGRQRAVITDFGLAARINTFQLDQSVQAGQGTPGYAPPEQWKDGKVSPASDQFSLGVVICELLTGKLPVLPKLGADKHWSRARLPAHEHLRGRIQSAICRCLEGDPEKRFSSVLELQRSLGLGRQTAILKVAVVGLVILALTIGTQLALSKPGYAIRDLRQLTPAMDLSTSPSFSQDGSIIAYASDTGGTGGSDIWVQPVPNGRPTRVTKSGRGNDDPSLSPDGHWVVYRSELEHGAVFLASVDSDEKRLIAAGGRNPRFSPDGRSVLYWTGNNNPTTPSGRIFVFDIARGSTVQLASGFFDAREPIWNSGGRHILFKGCGPGFDSVTACWDWWVTTIDGTPPRKTGARAKLDASGLILRGDIGGWYGDRVFFNGERGGEIHLWTLPVSTTTLRPIGNPEEVTPGDAREAVYSSTMAGRDSLAFTNLSCVVNIWRINFDRPGAPVTAQKITNDAEADLDPSLSRNGRWLTFVRGLPYDRAVWLMDTATGQERSYRLEGSDKFSPLVDDSGSEIAYEVWESGHPSIQLAVAGNKPRKLCSECRAPTSWFQGTDGLFLGDPSLSRIDLYNLGSGQRSTILSSPDLSLAQPSWSPAAKMLLFTSSPDRIRRQVYAVRLSATTGQPVGEWVPITGPTEDANFPRWSEDGKVVFYLSDRDNFSCIWGRRFDVREGKPVGKPFAIMHYHSLRLSSASIAPHSVNLSVAGNTVYLNIAEISSSVWIGHLERKSRLSQLFTIF
jgi:serine/threonine protein kinase